MRSVNVRQFQMKFYQEIQDLPVMLTQRVWVETPEKKKDGSPKKIAVNKPLCIVTAYEVKASDTPPVPTFQSVVEVPFAHAPVATINDDSPKKSNLFTRMFSRNK